MQVHAFTFHALRETLLIAAVLTAVALAFVDHAVLLVTTGIHQLLPNRSLEKAFAAFAAAAKFDGIFSI